MLALTLVRGGQDARQHARKAASVRGGPLRTEERPDGDRERIGTGEGEPTDERTR
jgi:hypothetical protein